MVSCKDEFKNKDRKIYSVVKDMEGITHIHLNFPRRSLEEVNDIAGTKAGHFLFLRKVQTANKSLKGNLPNTKIYKLINSLCSQSYRRKQYQTKKNCCERPR